MGGGGWGFREWQFSLTLCAENVLTYQGSGWFKKAITALRNIKMVLSSSIQLSRLLENKKLFIFLSKFKFLESIMVNQINRKSISYAYLLLKRVGPKFFESHFETDR